MDRESLNSLEMSTDVGKIKIILLAFNEKHAKLFDFSQFNASGQWPVIWKAVFNILRNDQHTDVYLECLSCVRILSRDKIYLNSTIDAKDFDCLLKIANLTDQLGAQKWLVSNNIIVEALKCLCNMVFQSMKCQDMCSKNFAVDGILNRVKSPQIFPYEIEFFDMKLLFLITGLNIKTRSRVRDDLNGLAYLTEWLNLKINDNDKSEEQIDLICEILKVLFNITVSSDEDSNSEENEIEYRRLTSIVRGLLLDYSTLNGEKEIQLISNVVNLLNNVPTVCISELLVGQTSVHKESAQAKIFESKCVLAVDVLLEYLKRKLYGSRDSPGQYENVAPILTVLVKCVRSSSTLRHYIRSVILPPLQDVKRRPEEGSELRNYLCRFLTIPYTQLRDLAAELLFVCCKEDVGRMIKHTGYGNAAGLLASRGLLGGRSNPTAEYSSDSEDSDTDEYKKMQHGINPVLGCYEAPKPNPLEGMSDEQKEYEAMQLVNLMDKLHRQGIIQPCRIGDDGKPQPVEDIRQLQEEIPQQQMDHKKKT